MKKAEGYPSLLDYLDDTKKNPKPLKKEKVFFDEYDEGTLLKLQILEDYLTCWLPVFLEKNVNHINIIDFFAGQGQDNQGNPGSPLKAIEVARKFERRKNGTEYPRSINLFFNDKTPACVERLKKSLDSLSTPANIRNVHISNETFEEALTNNYRYFEGPNVANFMFIDPFGLTDQRSVRKVTRLRQTDFLLFVPANNIYRLCETPEFQKYTPGLCKGDFESPETAHRVICEYIRKNWITQEANYYLNAFAIKKSSHQRHCLVFGSRSVVGLYKFIQNAWKVDRKNGEANFEFSGDLPNNGVLPGLSGPQKIRTFQRALRSDILSGKLKTNNDIFFYSLKAGFHPPSAQVKDVLKQLQKEKKIKVNLRLFGLSLSRKSIEPITLIL